jgi:hypothetical protein
MPIYSICPSCNTGYDLADSLRGKRVVCKTCNDSFLVQEALRVPSAAVPAGVPVEPPLAEPVYCLTPLDGPAPYPDSPGAPPSAASAHPPSRPESDWERLPRRRPVRRAAQPAGLSAGAIVAIVVTPIAVLLVVGILVWALLVRSQDTFLDDDAWGDIPPQAPVAQPAPRPGVGPVIVVPPPRFNNPAPPRFNPPVNPPRFNPPPPRGRFR